MQTVYIVQEPRSAKIDLSSAARYGTLMPVLSASDSPAIVPGPSLNKLKKGLRDFQPDDYIMMAGGDPVGIFLAGIALRDSGFKTVKLLRWERERSPDGERTGAGYYVPTEIPLT